MALTRFGYAVFSPVEIGLPKRQQLDLIFFLCFFYLNRARARALCQLAFASNRFRERNKSQSYSLKRNNQVLVVISCAVSRRFVLFRSVFFFGVFLYFYSNLLFVLLFSIYIYFYSFARHFWTASAAST